MTCMNIPVYYVAFHLYYIYRVIMALYRTTHLNFHIQYISDHDAIQTLPLYKDKTFKHVKYMQSQGNYIFIYILCIYT